MFGDRVVKNLSHGEAASESDEDDNIEVERDVDGDIEMNGGISHTPNMAEEEETGTLITHLAFSPDGQWLATTDSHCRTRIFNLDSVQVGD